MTYSGSSALPGSSSSPGSSSVSGSPTPLLDDTLIARLRSDLVTAKWTAASVEVLLSPMAFAAMKRDQFTPAAMELEQSTSASAVLTRLFMLAELVSVAQAGRAFPSLTVAGAKHLGLIEPAGSDSAMLRAAVDLRPYTADFLEEATEGVKTKKVSGTAAGAPQWWVASDLSQAQTGEPPREDYVLGIASASTTLARLTLRDRVDSALDLGCGCGILALQLTWHARHVVATDISERACTFTRFNALLNEVEIDVRQGSLFEPVAGEKFDLITSNPPFVITPQAVRGNAALEYRDGGMERDQLMPLVIEQAVPHLTPGGTLQMLGNWEVSGSEEEWDARPREWVEKAAAAALAEGQPVDAWLVQRDLLDISQYAEWWIRDGLGARVPLAQWQAAYREWIRDFSAAGTTWIGLGSLSLRIGDTFDAPRTTVMGGGTDATDDGTDIDDAVGQEPHLTLVCEYLPEGKPIDALAVKTALDNVTLPERWEELPLVCAADAREVRYFVPGSPDPQLIRMTQGRPGGRERSVTPAVAALIGVSEGELTPAQVIPAIATLLEQDESAVRAEIEAALPELLRAGVLGFGDLEG